MRASLLPSLAFLFVGLLSAPARAQSVWVVGPSADAQFSDLQTAVDQAADGDVVLVSSFGSGPSPITWSGKGLTVLSESQSPLGVRFVVSDVPAGSTVHLVRIGGWSSFTDCEGSVFLQGLRPTAPNTSVPALELTRCQNVVLLDCVVRGAQGMAGCWDDGVPGGPALWAVDTNLALYRSEVRGGKGSDGEDFFGCYHNGGPGGNGLESYGSTSVFVQDSVVAAGVHGWHGGGYPPGADHLEFDTSTYLEGVAGAPQLFGPHRAHAGFLYVLEVHGEPGALVSMEFGQQLSPVLPADPVLGIPHLGPTPMLRSLQVVPPSGVLQLVGAGWPLSFGAQAETRWLQVRAYGSSGDRLSNPYALLFVL